MLPYLQKDEDLSNPPDLRVVCGWSSNFSLKHHDSAQTVATLATLLNRLGPIRDKMRSRQAQGNLPGSGERIPGMLSVVPFQGWCNNCGPCESHAGPHCHFMVPSSDLFIESNQRKSMSMTFVVLLSILAQ